MHLNKSSALALILTALLALAAMFAHSFSKANVNQSFSALNPQKNAAVFAAYSADGTISEYVVDYLKKLKEIAPNIIFVTDNPIRRSEIKKIKPYISHLIAHRHSEYDWGSYKRGFNFLKQHGWASSSAAQLVLANDSALLVAPTLTPVITAAKESGADLFGITANIDGTYHLQSYFLVLSPKLYRHPEFSAYLNRVVPEKDGLTVAARYEVPFTPFVHSLGLKTAAYIAYDKLSALPLNDKNCYPLTMLSAFNAPFLKMRTFTTRLNVQEPRRLVFNWLKKHHPDTYKLLIAHLKKINSPYLKDARL